MKLPLNPHVGSFFTLWLNSVIFLAIKNSFTKVSLIAVQSFQEASEDQKVTENYPHSNRLFSTVFFIIDNPTYPQTLQAFIGYPYSK